MMKKFRGNESLRLGQKSNLIKFISSMEIEENILISFETWQRLGYKQDPRQRISAAVAYPPSYMKGKRYDTKKTQNGWIITRTQ